MKHGDPVKYCPGTNYRVLNNRYESFSMPTLEEIEQLRAEGKVWQLPKPPPGEARLGIDPYLANPNSPEQPMEQSSD